MPPSSRVACAVALLLLTAAAQDRPDTVIRTTTRVVQIRVMAEDSKGNPVTDLRKEELQLLDNRKPQAIGFLTAEGSTQHTGADASPGSSSDAAPPPREYAVILLDWLNPLYADRILVVDQVVKLLKNFHPRQEVALYLMGRNSGILHGFTSNPEELLQTVTNLKMEPEDPFDPQRPISISDPRYKNWVSLTTEEKIFRFNVKIQDTFETLNKLATGLARVRGQKSVIWVTNGFPLVLDQHAVAGAKPGEIEYPEDMEIAVAKLNRADIALYTVDARGLSGHYGDVGTLQEFSARTGATSFAGRNDLDEGMRLALEDTKVSYTLGFTVPPNAVPGLHAIQLRTTRRGVTLRYRESYQLDDAPIK